jgi:N-methylhydantoinase A
MTEAATVSADATGGRPRYRVGVDVGGTFTDCVVIDNASGEVVKVAKTPTTPDDQSRGFLAAVEATGVPLDQVELVLHGCTVGLNAIITRTGSTTGLLTTAGFRDVIAMGRGQRPAVDQFNPRWQRDFGDAARPFVPRSLRLPVRERIGSAGQVLEGLHEEDVERQCEFLLAQGVEAIAICFINAYANPAHEARAKEIVAALAPQVLCFTSTEVHPCFKEYPRFSTCVLNTYVAPLVDRYFERTEMLLAEGGYANPLMIMQSNGGVSSAETARKRPAYTLQSGPTGGVAAARNWSAQLGLEQVLTLDIGGTSADYAMIDRGEPVMTTELELDHDVVVALPAVDLHSIGAGGGSIAWVDDFGALRVGPDSAGSVPGPASYGRGGERATVTDAFVASGLLPQAAFRDKSFVLRPDLAQAALEPLAQRLACSVEEAAAAVLRVSLANLVEAAREVSVYSGVDPRDFTMFVFGAAGPLFGSRIGRELGVAGLIVPPLAGTMSAYGLSMSGVRLDLSAPLVRGLEALPPETLTEIYAGLEAEGREVLGLGDDARIVRWLDGRYRGQTWDTPSVPVPGSTLGAAEIAEVRAGFDSTHERLWGYSLPDYEVTAMMARITVLADEEVVRGAVTPTPTEAEDAPTTTKAFIDGEWRDLALHFRENLAAGDVVEGPAVIIEETTTIVVMPGDRASIDELGHVWITWEGAAA